MKTLEVGKTYKSTICNGVDEITIVKRTAKTVVYVGEWYGSREHRALIRFDSKGDEYIETKSRGNFHATDEVTKTAPEITETPAATEEQMIEAVGKRAEELAKDPTVKAKAKELYEKFGMEAAKKFVYQLAIATLCGAENYAALCGGEMEAPEQAAVNEQETPAPDADDVQPETGAEAPDQPDPDQPEQAAPVKTPVKADKAAYPTIYQKIATLTEKASRARAAYYELDKAGKREEAQEAFNEWWKLTEQIDALEAKVPKAEAHNPATAAKIDRLVTALITVCWWINIDKENGDRVDAALFDKMDMICAALDRCNASPNIRFDAEDLYASVEIGDKFYYVGETNSYRPEDVAETEALIAMLEDETAAPSCQRFTIYADKADEVRKALDRLAKKAARYDVPFAYTISEEQPATVYVYDESHIVGRPPEEYIVPAVDVTIDGDGLIRRNGWTVCAHIEHGEAGNIVTALNGENADSEWFHAPPCCDHCGTNHLRKITYMVRSESGEIKQVGRSCLKDYTGINPAAALLWAEVRDLMPEVRDCTLDEWEHGGYAPMYDVKTIIALAVDAITECGYRKAKEPDSTRSKVTVAFVREKEPSKEAWEKAAEVVDWLKGLAEVDRKETEWNKAYCERVYAKAAADGFVPTGSGFSYTDGKRCCYDSEIEDMYGDGEKNPFKMNWGPERNCIPLAVSGYARARHFGLLAYMPLAYDRYMERKAREAKRQTEKETEAAASDYVGQVKDRLTIQTATAALLTSWETDFGTTYLYKFTDAAGNVFIWKASAKVDGLTDNVTLKGTVKAHNERDGVKQTVLTRCKITA